MKCDKCNMPVNPGDQICMHCGSKLPLSNMVIPGVEQNNNKIEDKKNNKFLIVFIILGIVLMIIIVFLIVKFLVL